MTERLNEYLVEEEDVDVKSAITDVLAVLRSYGCYRFAASPEVEAPPPEV